MVKGFLFTLILVALAIIGFQYATPAPLLEAPAGAAADRTTFESADGLKISGSYYIPVGAGPVPVVILAHQNNATRSQYDFLVPLLIERGFAVLAYDARGFGKSEGESDDYNKAPFDMIGALNFLEKDRRIDPARIYAIGASMGANTAYVTTALDRRLKYAFVLSPSTHAQASLDELQAPRRPQNVIIVGTEEDTSSSAQALFDYASEPKNLIMYKGNRHGIQLLQGIKQGELLDLLLKLK